MNARITSREGKTRVTLGDPEKVAEGKSSYDMYEFSWIVQMTTWYLNDQVRQAGGIPYIPTSFNICGPS